MQEDAFTAVEQSIEEDPKETIRYLAQQLELCPSALCKILRKDRDLKLNEYQACRTFG